MDLQSVDLPPFVFVTVFVSGVQVPTPPPGVVEEPYDGGLSLGSGPAETMLLKPNKATSAALSGVCILNALNTRIGNESNKLTKEFAVLHLAAEDVEQDEE